MSITGQLVLFSFGSTIMILSFGTHRSGQTVYFKNRKISDTRCNQPDLGLHGLLRTVCPKKLRKITVDPNQTAPSRSGSTLFAQTLLSEMCRVA